MLLQWHASLDFNSDRSNEFVVFRMNYSLSKLFSTRNILFTTVYIRAKTNAHVSMSF